MRHALRRVLWIVPTLFVISLAVFWLLTPGHRPRSVEPDPDHPFFGGHAPPRFLNLHPTNVRDRALALMRHIATAEDDAERARRELTRLGGAALPHVLPALDSLDPRGRARVALALAPLAARMNVGTAEELRSPESAVLFWTRFWQDRAIEFRPAVVKRAVTRLGEKSTAGRREDVRQMDTYALPELMDRMSPLETPEDVRRVRRLAAAAARIVERPWRVPKDASVEEARSVVRLWQAWWLEHRSDYVTHDGPERLLSMVSDTQYGRWASSAALHRLGVTATGEPVLDVLLARAPVTLWLLGCALVAGWLAGIAIGLAGAVRARRTPDLASTAVAVALGAAPVTVLATAIAPVTTPRLVHAVGALVMALGSAALVSRHQRVATRAALDQEDTRTARAFGAGPWRLARWSFRGSSVAVLAWVPAHLPGLLTAAFVVEHALGLNGLGAATLRAVAARDVAWLMALALATATALALTQVASDALLAALDPRVRLGLLRERGAAE